MTDNTWTETGLTYSNAPAMGTQLGSSGTFSAGTCPLRYTSGVLRKTSVDVTSYITGDGVYNFAFSTTSSTNISFSSREGANASQLVIETSSGPTNTPAATNTPGPTATASQTATLTPVGSNTPTMPPTVTPTTPPTFQNASFIYDGDGKRVKSTINGTITTYFVGAHFEVNGSTVTKYYYAGAQRIAMRTGTWNWSPSNPVTGTLSYLLSDHLGSASLVADAAGMVVSELKYKAWGEVRYASGTSPTKYQFTGQFSYEMEFGLMFYNARWYDSYITQFSQPDSIIPDQYNSQDWNRYSYARNNPVRYTDPSGHRPACDEGEDCSQILRFWRLSGVQYWKALIKDDFGITMSDEGSKNWTESNLGLVYNSLSNINTALNGKLKSLASGWTFMMQNQTGKGEYHGVTHTDGSMIINFFTRGDAAIRQMNIYHEFGHLLDNRPGMENEFTNAVPNGASWVSGNKINPNALLNPNSVYDPNYGTAQAIQGILTVGPPDEWADAFANYVAGNIMPTGPGAAMYTFVTGALAPYIGAP